MNEPLTPERETEIRETQLGEWYDGPWTQGYVEGSGDDPAYYRVTHEESGTTLATLPDWAGPIALFIADAHDAVTELLAALDRVRAERDQYATELDGIHLAAWEAQLKRERDQYRAERDAYCDRVDTLTAVAQGNKRHVQLMYADLQKAQAERDQYRAAAERAEAKLRKIQHGCETPESHLYGCPCTVRPGSREEPHDDPVGLHHDYRIGHDLPETTA